MQDVFRKWNSLDWRYRLYIAHKRSYYRSQKRACLFFGKQEKVQIEFLVWLPSEEILRENMFKVEGIWRKKIR